MPVPTAAEAAFLEAIRAHPEADEPRLVYADWLEERGDPRGDFIRAHCHFQDLVGRLCYPDTPIRWEHLWAYFPVVEAWLGPVPAGLQVALECGVPIASMPLPRFLRAEEILATTLPDHPWLDRLPPVRLNLAGDSVRYVGLEGLAALPWLAGLDLSGHAGATDARLAVLAGRHELATLVLARTALTDAGLGHLTELAGLRLLNLLGTAVTDAGLERLASLGGLRRLDVTGTQVTAAGVTHFRLDRPDCLLVCDPASDAHFPRLHAWRGVEPR
jgi:uncharacterized protein (TIGR02996 family)